MSDDLIERLRRRIAAVRMVLGMSVLQTRMRDQEGEFSPSGLFNDIEQALTRSSVPLPESVRDATELAEAELERLEAPDDLRAARKIDRKDVYPIIWRMRDRILQSSAPATETALDWLAGQHRLELSYSSPTYCDDDDSEEWQVHRVGGSINDREWELVGRGATPLEAIEAARAKATAGEGEGK